MCLSRRELISGSSGERWAKLEGKKTTRGAEGRGKHITCTIAWCGPYEDPSLPRQSPRKPANLPRFSHETTRACPIKAICANDDLSHLARRRLVQTQHACPWSNSMDITQTLRSDSSALPRNHAQSHHIHGQSHAAVALGACGRRSGYPISM